MPCVNISLLFIFQKDLVGGYYDAGDHIKFGFPGAFTITMLSWSVIEYGHKYEGIGELDHIKELIKWGTNYMLKTFNASAVQNIDVIYSQVILFLFSLYHPITWIYTMIKTNSIYTFKMNIPYIYYINVDDSRTCSHYMRIAWF